MPTSSPGPVLARPRLKVRCKPATRSRGRVVRFSLRRTGDVVDKAVFRIGGKRVGRDRTSPYVVTKRLAAVRDLRGRPKARVVFEDGSVRVLRVKRPGCLR